VLNADFGRYRIVHFATHSVLNEERPQLSGVVLSLFDRSGRPQNGFLRLYDIYNLRLGSDRGAQRMPNGAGWRVRGEGLIGLTRGFSDAGPARGGDPWAVDDRTTAELDEAILRRSVGPPREVAAALRAAGCLWKTKGWDAPYYWAAFTLQGEWR
jgi:CHAT domain-containing protein